MRVGWYCLMHFDLKTIWAILWIFEVQQRPVSKCQKGCFSKVEQLVSVLKYCILIFDPFHIIYTKLKLRVMHSFQWRWDLSRITHLFPPSGPHLLTNPSSMSKSEAQKTWKLSSNSGKKSTLKLKKVCPKIGLVSHWYRSMLSFAK